jgi:hypothetical protein
MKFDFHLLTNFFLLALEGFYRRYGTGKSAEIKSILFINFRGK